MEKKLAMNCVIMLSLKKSGVLLIKNQSGFYSLVSPLELPEDVTVDVIDKFMDVL